MEGEGTELLKAFSFLTTASIGDDIALQLFFLAGDRKPLDCVDAPTVFSCSGCMLEDAANV